MQRGLYEYFPIERVVFGEPFAAALKEEAERTGARRLFVLSSRQLSRTTPVIDELRATLGDRFAGLFDETAPHTPRETVLAATEAVREASADLLVAIGGGSVIDLAKMVQIGLAEDITERGQFDAFHLRRAAGGSMVTPTIAEKAPRQIAIPTTLSGAEFTHTAGSFDEAGIKKDLYVARHLAPKTVILDPALARYTPDWLWFSTAVRSIDHAVESICSLTAQPITDANCIHGLRMLQRSLRRSRREPDDLSARLDSQLGVWLCCAGLARGQHGASHGVGYAVGAVGGVPHGHCSCVLLPAVLRFNKPVNAAQQMLVADALDAPGEDAGMALLRLLEDIGVPTRLQDVGIRRDQFEQIAQTVLANGYVRTNPRPISDSAGVVAVLEEAWGR